MAHKDLTPRDLDNMSREQLLSLAEALIEDHAALEQRLDLLQRMEQQQ